MDRALSPAPSSHLSFCRASDGSSVVLPNLPLQIGFPLEASGGILLHPTPRDTSNLGTGTTLHRGTPPTPSKQHPPPPTWVLTELALLGLGQGLPAPGPLTGERDKDNEKDAINANMGSASRGRTRGPKSLIGSPHSPRTGVKTCTFMGRNLQTPIHYMQNLLRTVFPRQVHFSKKDTDTHRDLLPQKVLYH